VVRFCPKCGTDIHWVERAFLFAPTWSPDFRLAVFHMSNCPVCNELVIKLMERRSGPKLDLQRDKGA